MVQRRHGVERVRQTLRAHGQRGEAGVVGSCGMAQADGEGGVGFEEGADQGGGPGEFGREGEEFDDVGEVGFAVE